jgi:hypothetical protein
MTFLTELERLLAEHKAEGNAVIRFGIGQQIECLLWNNVYTILGLVRAAESLSSQYPEKRDGMDGEILPVGVKGIRYALAKLNGAEK